MVAENSVHTFEVNQVFRFVEDIGLNQKSRQIRFVIRKRPILIHMCATCSELPLYISTMPVTLVNTLSVADPDPKIWVLRIRIRIKYFVLDFLS